MPERQVPDVRGVDIRTKAPEAAVQALHPAAAGTEGFPCCSNAATHCYLSHTRHTMERKVFFHVQILRQAPRLRRRLRSAGRASLLRLRGPDRLRAHHLRLPADRDLRRDVRPHEGGARRSGRRLHRHGPARHEYFLPGLPRLRISHGLHLRLVLLPQACHAAARLYPLLPRHGLHPPGPQHALADHLLS